MARGWQGMASAAQSPRNRLSPGPGRVFAGDAVIIETPVAIDLAARSGGAVPGEIEGEGRVRSNEGAGCNLRVRCAIDVGYGIVGLRNDVTGGTGDVIGHAVRGGIMGCVNADSDRIDCGDVAHINEESARLPGMAIIAGINAISLFMARGVAATMLHNATGQVHAMALLACKEVEAVLPQNAAMVIFMGWPDEVR